MAGSAELEIHREHLRRKIVRRPRGSSGDMDGVVDRACLRVLRVAGILTCAVFRGIGRKFLSDLRASAPYEAFSLCFTSGSRRPRLGLQRDFEARDGDQRNPGNATARPIHRAGRGSNPLKAAAGVVAVAIQNVALSLTRGADDFGVGVAFLANGFGENLGISRDRFGNDCISYLGTYNATMAV